MWVEQRLKELRLGNANFEVHNFCSSTHHLVRTQHYYIPKQIREVDSRSRFSQFDDWGSLQPCHGEVDQRQRSFEDAIFRTNDVKHKHKRKYNGYFCVKKLSSTHSLISTPPNYFQSYNCIQFTANFTCLIYGFVSKQ